MDRVKEADYINYLATLLMPREAIPHVFAILALNVELATLRNTIARNTGTADINKLAFWKDTIDSVFGIKKCPIPRQPTAQALKQFLKSETTIEYLHDMITARQKTLGDRPFKTMADLEDYGAKTNGSVIKIMCEGLNEYDRKLSENSINAADSMGKAVTIVNHIRSIVPLLKRGIVLLPQDIMTLNEYSGDKLYNGKEIDKACLVVRELSRVAEFHLREARQVKDFVHQKQRLAFLGASLACDYHLEGLKKNNFMFNYGELQKNDPFVAMKLAKMRLFRSY
uniref:Squalene/phytoene synthase n=1 Tax=Rhabditophanes sp. KR3021 TaxID=114890 RepID=A0AC35TSW8_9BILA